MKHVTEAKLTSSELSFKVTYLYIVEIYCTCSRRRILVKPKLVVALTTRIFDISDARKENVPWDIRSKENILSCTILCHRDFMRFMKVGSE